MNGRPLPALLVVALALPSAAAHDLDGSWPMFRRDADRSGDGTEFVPRSCDALWTFHSGDAKSSSPVATGGRVYFGSGDGQVYALDAADGRVLWTAATNASVTSTPAVVDGTLFVGSWDKQLYAFDAATGARTWAYEAGAVVQSSPVVAGGVVYVGDNLGVVHAVRADTGARVWSDAGLADDAVYSSPAHDGARIYFGSADGHLVAAWASNGTRAWSYTTQGEVLATPAIHNGVVYVSALDGRLYAFDALTRASPWDDPFHAGAAITASAAVAEALVVVPDYAARLHAVSTVTGRERWNASLDAATHSSPALVGGVALVGTSAGTFYAFDATNGEELWRCAGLGAIHTSPAVAAGRVFVLADDGVLHAFGDATPPQNHPPELGAFVPVDGAAGRAADLTLTWTGGDADEGDRVAYSVRFGITTDPPVKATGLRTSDWRPAGLEPSTTYRWRVTAVDNHGASAEGPLLSFTTASEEPSTATQTASPGGDGEGGESPGLDLLLLFAALGPAAAAARRRRQ